MGKTTLMAYLVLRQLFWSPRDRRHSKRIPTALYLSIKKESLKDLEGFIKSYLKSIKELSLIKIKKDDSIMVVLESAYIDIQ